MPILLVSESGNVRAIPLAAATLVGRASSCLARVANESCPAHWLELRWCIDGWTWRALSAGDRTHGGGAFLAHGWRGLNAGGGRGTRIRLAGTSVYMELVEGGAPRPFAWDVMADEPLDGEALAEVAEVHEALLLPLSAEGDQAQALSDGQAWVHLAPPGAPRTLRAHVPSVLAPTVSPIMDFARDGMTVDIDLPKLRATFLQGDSVAVVSGECVRVLAVFAIARQRGEGWLHASEAWARWTELGGAQDTALERMSWERGKLRGQLARQRVTGLALVFSNRKLHAFVECRLGANSAAIFVQH